MIIHALATKATTPWIITGADRSDTLSRIRHNFESIMAKDKFTLMDFVKKQGLGNITGVFGEECLNEDGTIMSMADQAAVITHYLKLQGTPFEDTYKQKALAFMAAWEKGFEHHLFRGC